MQKMHIANSINTDETTNDRFTSLENEVILLNVKVDNISNLLEEKRYHQKYLKIKVILKK